MHLAMFYSNKEVSQLVKKQFGIHVKPNHIGFYDAGAVGYNKSQLSRRWKDLFFEVREKYIEEAQKVPIAHKGFRLNGLQRLFEIYMKDKDYTKVQSVLEQAAKEVGGLFEHKELITQGEGTTTVNTFIQNIYNKLPEMTNQNGHHVNGENGHQKRIEGDIDE